MRLICGIANWYAELTGSAQFFLTVMFFVFFLPTVLKQVIQILALMKGVKI
jgi:hypothetical protein